MTSGESCRTGNWPGLRGHLTPSSGRFAANGPSKRTQFRLLKVATLPARRNQQNRPEAPPTAEVTDDSDSVLPQRGIPDRLKSTFDAVPEFRSVLKRIADLKAAVQLLAGAPAGVVLNFYAVKRDLDNVRRAVRFSIPHAVCPYCTAESGNCDACAGRGWVTEAVFNQAPEDMK